MNHRALTYLIVIYLAIHGLFSCSEAPVDPDVYNASDSLDVRGDLNLDGLSYTVADAVMFSNYFVQGEEALAYIEGPNLWGFAQGYAGSIAASYVNADGKTLGVADLVYLIRIVTGDALPYPQTTPVAANLLFINSTLTVDKEMCAASVVIAGDKSPSLLAWGMDIKTRFDGENTRVLVWSVEGNTFRGEFLGYVDELVSAELATADGAPVVWNNLPVNLVLDQNYPNPFISSTTIKFALPEDTDYSLVIRNSADIVVYSNYGHAEAGYHVFLWDATGYATGFYYATLTVGDWEGRIKMLLRL